MTDAATGGANSAPAGGNVSTPSMPSGTQVVETTGAGSNAPSAPVYPGGATSAPQIGIAPGMSDSQRAAVEFINTNRALYAKSDYDNASQLHRDYRAASRTPTKVDPCRRS